MGSDLRSPPQGSGKLGCEYPGRSARAGEMQRGDRGEPGREVALMGRGADEGGTLEAPGSPPALPQGILSRGLSWALGDCSRNGVLMRDSGHE